MQRMTRRPSARRWLAGLTVLVLLAGVAVIPPAPVAAVEPADMVRDWNLIAAQALSNPSTASPPGAGQPPPYAAINMAMVQLAVYDAVNAIDGGHEPYLTGLPAAPSTASKAAAAATAAHHVLVGIDPPLPLAVRNDLDDRYSGASGSLSEIPDGQAKTDGIAIGAAAANAMLDERIRVRHDGRFGSFRFTPGTGVGEWRPVLPAFVNDPFGWLARVRPFALESTSQLRTAGPLPVTSPEYAAEFDEVKALGGSAATSSRSEAQTTLARFVTANPLPMLNRGLRDVSAGRGLTITQDARLFALSSTSAADALISCWDDKAHWNFWRPITAIRLAADDGNPATAPDEAWTPFFNTPPYPDHPSGYNCFTGAMMHSARLYFGTDRVTFDLTSSGSGTTNTYHRFTDVVRDTIDGRIYTGFHFRTPDVQGAWIGKKAAQWVAKHYLQPVD